jgi:hypothetical protein
MKIIDNKKKIARNRKIGLYASLSSLVILVGGFILSLNPEQLALAYGALLAGLLLSQLGIYFGNRWGRTPRMDERLNQALKGLDDRFTIYHYMTAVPHLLTGPSGFWVIVPQHQPGTITYENNRFKQKGVFFLSRLFAQEGVGRPDLEAQAHKQDLEKFLQKSLTEESIPEVQAVIVFVSPKANVQTADSPTPAMHVEKLKDFVRRKGKEQQLNLGTLRSVVKLLPEESIY